MSSILQAQEQFQRRFLEVRKRKPKRAEVLNYFKKSGVDLESLMVGGRPTGKFAKYQDLDQEFLPTQTQDEYFAQLAQTPDPVPEPLPPGKSTINVSQAFADAAAQIAEQFPDVEPVEELTMRPESLLAQMEGVDPQLVQIAASTEGGLELLKRLEALRLLQREQEAEAAAEGARRRQEAVDWFRKMNRKQRQRPEGLQQAQEDAIKLRRQLDNSRLHYHYTTINNPGMISLRQMKAEAGSVRSYLYNLAETNPQYREIIENAKRPASRRGKSPLDEQSDSFGTLHNLLALQSRFDAADERRKQLTAEWENVPADKEFPEEKELQKLLANIEGQLSEKQLAFTAIYRQAQQEMPEEFAEGLDGQVMNTQKLAEEKAGSLWDEIQDLKVREEEARRHLRNFKYFGTAEPNDMIPYDIAGMLGEWGGTSFGTAASMGAFAAEAVAFTPTLAMAELFGDSYYEEPAYDDQGQPIMVEKRDPETGAVVMENGQPVMVQKLTRRLFTASTALTEGAPENLRSDVINQMLDGYYENVDVQEAAMKDRLSEAAVEDAAMLVTGIAHLVGAFLPGPSTLLNSEARGKTYTPEELKEVLQQPRGFERFVHKLEEGYGTHNSLVPKMVGAMVQIVANPVRSFNTQPVSTVLTLLPFMRLLTKYGVAKAGMAVAELEKLAKDMGVNDTKFGLSRPTIQSMNGHIQKMLASPEGALATNRFVQALLSRKLLTAVKRNRDLQQAVDKNPILKKRLAERGDSAKLFETASEVIDYAGEVGLVNPLIKGGVKYGAMAMALEDRHWDTLDPYLGLGMVVGVPGVKAAIKAHTPDAATAFWNQMVSDIAYQTDPVMQDLAHSIKEGVTQAGGEVKARMARLATESQRAMKNGELLYDSNQVPYQESVIYTIKANALSDVKKARNNPDSRLARVDQELNNVERQIADRAEAWDHLPSESMPVEVVGLGTFDAAPQGHAQFVADVNAARASNRAVVHDPSAFRVFEVERPGGNLSNNRLYVHRTAAGKETLYAVDQAGRTVAYMDYTVNPLRRADDAFGGIDPLTEAPEIARLGQEGFRLTQVDQPNIQVTNFGVALEAGGRLQNTMVRHLQSRSGSVDGVGFSGNAVNLGKGLKSAAERGQGGVPYLPGEYVPAHGVHPYLVERAVAQGKPVPKSVLKVYQERLGITDDVIDNALEQFERFPEYQRAMREVLMEENLIWHESLREQGAMARENSVSLGLQRLDLLRSSLKRDYEARVNKINKDYDERAADTQRVADETPPTPEQLQRQATALERATRKTTAQINALKQARKEARETFVKDLAALKGNKRDTYVATTSTMGGLLERRISINSTLEQAKTTNRRMRATTVETAQAAVESAEASIASLKRSYASKKAAVTKQRNLNKKNRRKGIKASEAKARFADLEAQYLSELQPLQDALTNAQRLQKNFTEARVKDATKITDIDTRITNQRDVLAGIERSFADQEVALRSAFEKQLADIDGKIEAANIALKEAGNKATNKASQALELLQKQRENLLKKEAAAYQQKLAVVADVQNMQLNQLADLVQNVRNNLFGSIADAPQLTQYADQPVVYRADTGTFVDRIIDDAGRPQAIRLPEDTAPAAVDLNGRLGALIDRVRVAPDAAVNEAMALIIDISDAMVQAEGGLNYSPRQLNKIMNKIGVGNLKGGAALEASLRNALKGGRGGINLMRRIYAETLMSFITDNAHARLLTSEAARGRFRSWLIDKKGFNLPEKVMGRRTKADAPFDAVTFGRAVDKLILGYSQGRSNGGAIFRISDPVIVVGNKTIRLSNAFEQWAVREAKGTVLTDAVGSSLNTMSHMMARNVEARISAKILAKEMEGVKGWTDEGLTVDYAEGIYGYFLENGRVPPVLKGRPKAWDEWVTSPDQVRAITERIGAEGYQRLVTETARYADQTTQMDNVVPQMSDIGAAGAAVYERGVGLSRGKLPVMVDNLSSLADSLGIERSTYLDNGLRQTLGWLHETNGFLQADMPFLTAMSQHVKMNLTALRPATAVNNIMSNYYNKLTHDGVDPVTGATQLYQTINLGQKAKWAPETLAPEVLADFNYLKDTGFDWSTFIDAEVAGAVQHGIKNAANPSTTAALFQYVQGFVHQGRIGSWDVPVAGSLIKGVTKTLIEAYRQGDIIFKLDTSIREMARSRTALERLSVGRRVTLRDSNTGVLQGRVFKLENGKFEFVDRRGKRTVVDNIDHPLINTARARSAMGKANARFVDFADAQGLLRFVKKFDFLVGGPFRTWIWKTIDIPGVKKGIVYHTFFDDFSMMSNDPVIMNELMLDAMGAQARRGLVANVYNHVEEDDRYKRRLIPQYQQMTADFKSGKSYTTVGQKNFASGLWTIIQALEIASTPEGEQRLDEKMRRQKGAAALIAVNTFMDRGLFVDMYETYTHGETRTGRKFEKWSDYVWHFADMVVPGYQVAIADSVGTFVNPLSHFSRYDLDQRMDPQQHTRVDAYLLKNALGYRLSQYDPKTQLKAWKAASAAIKQERDKRLAQAQENLDASSEQRREAIEKINMWYNAVSEQFDEAFQELEKYVGERPE